MISYGLDPKFIAGMAVLRRTGINTFRIGHTDDEDGAPIIWHCSGTWGTSSECDAALDPIEALMRLCERVIDGGLCAHCRRRTIFLPDHIHLGEAIESVGGCVYAWDPELRVFRRGCE